MRILDRERYWAFLKAYFICFVALVGLYVVIDSFSNLDEFEEISPTTADLFRNMGRYYLIKMTLFYDQICGIITMMAAIFAVTWLQKDNELLAMLAAGISTHRVIRPVLVSALLISSLAVVNQEFIMPRFAEELQRTPDDDGSLLLKVYPRQDANEVLLQGSNANRTRKSVERFSATIPVRVAGELIEIYAMEAIYVPEADPDSSVRGGWVLWGTKFLTAESPSRPFEELTKGVLIEVEDRHACPQPLDKLAGKSGSPVYFLKTNLTFSELTRSPSWYRFAPTLELIRALSDPSNVGERTEISIFLHSRIIRPLLGFNLMLLSLPLVLGGVGRNMFINLGLSLGTSGLFYSATFLSQYLGGHEIYSPEMAAWAPLIFFGTFATARWDTIRT